MLLGGEINDQYIYEHHTIFLFHIINLRYMNQINKDMFWENLFCSDKLHKSTIVY